MDLSYECFVVMKPSEIQLQKSQDSTDQEWAGKFHRMLSEGAIAQATSIFADYP